MDSQHLADATDTDLARAWAAGDERAYDAIVARFAPLVFNRCRLALGAADADDATQAVFLILAQKREQAAASPVLAAWLMQVANNVVRNAWRDRQRRRSAETSVPPPQPVIAEEPAMPGIKDHLDACLAELPEREREAVMLHHLAGRTLAEVSRQTGAGLSTVRYRIERGLERLRTLLARRGVAVSSVALAAVLASEAQAAVPAEVLAHLHDLAHAGGGAGSTAAPSERVVRWSRQRSSTMTRIAIAAAGILLVGGAAWQFLPSAEPTGPGASAQAHPPAPAPVPLTGDPIRDLDPQHARTWLVIRANDGARSVQRLRAQPEMALLPAAQRGWLDDLATLREAVVVVDQDSLLPDHERVGTYRLQQEIAGMTPAQQQDRILSEVRRKVADGKAPAGAAQVPVFSGWIDATAADAALIGRLRSTLPALPVRADGGGWIVATAAGDERITIDGRRIAFAPPAAAAAVPAAIAAIAGTASVPAAEIEFTALLDTGRPGVAPARMISGSLAIGDDGLRFSSLAEGGVAGPAGRPLDRSRFDAVPASAILAGAIAMHRGDQAGGGFFAGMLAAVTVPLEAGPGGMPAEAKAALAAVGRLLDAADGTMIGWLEPGAPFPSLTIEADLAQADALAVIDATGLVRAADGSATTMAGPVMLSLGWVDGRFIATTNPAGIEGIDRRGGFTAHPEVRRALAAMPATPIASCALIRPAATLDLAMPFGAMLVPGLQRQLMDYRTALVTSQGYGFITGATDGRKHRVEAGGIFALVGCAILAGKAADPASRVQVAN